MNYRGRRIIARVHLERKYEELGLKDYKLHDLNQLREIHNIDVNEIPGYKELPDKQRELFNAAVINFYNAWGLDRRKELIPKSVNYVYEVNYSKQLSKDDDFWTDVGQEVFVLDEKGGILRRLHRYVHNKGINFKTCEKDTKIYLRFELNDVWYHIISANKWY